MDDLIARVLAGDATDIEKQHLRRWLQEDAQNERLFRDTEAAWKAFDVMAGTATPPPPDVSEIVRSARRRRFLPGRRMLLTAAAFVAVAAAGTFAYLRTGGLETASVPTEPTPALALVASVVGSGGVSTLTLSDGSVARLAPGGRLDLLPQNGARAVALEGRAFFAVAPGSDPFTVSTPTGSAQVLGTRFEVATSSDGTRVVVVEGSVLLSGTWGPSERADANTVGLLTRGARPRVDIVPDPWSLLDWPGGLLLFQATPLSDVARELERRFGVDVSVTDPSLATRRVTAWFGDETFDQVLDAVCLVTAVSCRVAPGAAYIGG